MMNILFQAQTRGGAVSTYSACRQAYWTDQKEI